MLVAANPISNKRIVLAKQIFQRALVHAQAVNSLVDRVFSVVAFDLSTESLLKAALKDLKPAWNHRGYFPEIIGLLKTEVEGRDARLPETARITHIHDLRNAAQHNARYPNETEISDSRTYTRDFLVELCPIIWGVQFEDLSLVNLVQNETVRGWLNESEGLLAEGDTSNAAVKAVAAFSSSFAGLAGSITGDLDWGIDAIVVEKGRKALPDRKTLTALKRTRELVTLQVVGINAQEHLRFKRYTRYLNVSFTGNHRINATLSGPAPTAEQAGFILSFVTNAVVALEAIDDEVAKPFDRFPK